VENIASVAWSHGAKNNDLHRAVLKIEWRIVAMQRYEGVREYFSLVLEVFVFKVVRFSEE